MMYIFKAGMDRLRECLKVGMLTAIAVVAFIVGSAMAPADDVIQLISVCLGETITQLFDFTNLSGEAICTKDDRVLFTDIYRNKENQVLLYINNVTSAAKGVYICDIRGKAIGYNVSVISDCKHDTHTCNFVPWLVAVCVLALTVCVLAVPAVYRAVQFSMKLYGSWKEISKKDRSDTPLSYTPISASDDSRENAEPTDSKVKGYPSTTIFSVSGLDDEVLENPDLS